MGQGPGWEASLTLQGSPRQGEVAVGPDGRTSSLAVCLSVCLRWTCTGISQPHSHPRLTLQKGSAHSQSRLICFLVPPAHLQEVQCRLLSTEASVVEEQAAFSLLRLSFLSCERKGFPDHDGLHVPSKSHTEM